MPEMEKIDADLCNWWCRYLDHSVDGGTLGFVDKRVFWKVGQVGCFALIPVAGKYRLVNKNLRYSRFFRTLHEAKCALFRALAQGMF